MHQKCGPDFKAGDRDARPLQRQSCDPCNYKHGAKWGVQGDQNEEAADQRKMIHHPYSSHTDI